MTESRATEIVKEYCHLTDFKIISVTLSGWAVKIEIRYMHNCRVEFLTLLNKKVAYDTLNERMV